MTRLSRRAALGIALLPIAGPAPVFASVMSPVGEMIADWKVASAEYLAAAETLEKLEADNPDVRDLWPSVEIGFGRVPCSFPLGIKHELRAVAEKLKAAYGDIVEVEEASALLDRFEVIAQRRLADINAECERIEEACGIAAVKRSMWTSSDRERNAFQAIVNFAPATADQAAEKNLFLLEYVARWPGDHKVADIREALFKSVT